MKKKIDKKTGLVCQCGHSTLPNWDKKDRFTYSVLVKRKGLCKRFDGLYWNLKYAKQQAKVLKGKVIRFKNNIDGSCSVTGKYVILRGKL